VAARQAAREVLTPCRHAALQFAGVHNGTRLWRAPRPGRAGARPDHPISGMCNAIFAMMIGVRLRLRKPMSHMRI
jgi:hypothetical protein